MKPIIKFCIVVFFSFIYAESFPQQKSGFKKIEDGLYYKQINNTSDTLIFHIIKLDLNNTELNIAAAKAGVSLNARETTSSIVNRYDSDSLIVLAAINADLFKLTEGGEPENNMISFGEFVKGCKLTDSPYDLFDNIHSQFAITIDKKPLIERFEFNGKLLLKNNFVFEINRINSQTDSNSITIYNYYHGKSTPLQKNQNKTLELECLVLNISKDTLYLISTGTTSFSGNLELKEDNYIISASGDISDRFKDLVSKEDTIYAIIRLKPFYPGIIHLVGGWPRIVNDGINMATLADSIEGTFTKFSANRHPRTGIGFSQDSTKIFFFVIDGRQVNSRGVTLSEFAEIMISEGVYQGLNLDGGGSSTMIIKNKIVNSPSDKNGERPVGNSLLIYKTKNHRKGLYETE